MIFFHTTYDIYTINIYMYVNYELKFLMIIQLYKMVQIFCIYNVYIQEFKTIFFLTVHCNVFRIILLIIRKIEITFFSKYKIKFIVLH